jgi:ADP-heptose:LPS heptosyltransferase
MIEKIAVLRANALGDFIFVMPALQALRDTFPDAEIVLLGKELHKKLLAERPSPIDRVVVVPPYPGVGESESYHFNEVLVEQFFDRMRDENFDVVFQMHGGGKYSNPFVQKLGAKKTIGSKAHDAVPLDISIPYSTYFNETLRYLELVSLIGAKASTLEPCIHVIAKDLAEVQVLLGDHEEKPIAVLQPGATDPRRWWPVERFARVADELVHSGYYVCFNGVAAEFDLVENAISLMTHQEHVSNLAGKMSLSGLIGLLSKASLMVSNDTGPLHLAYALNTPSVGLYWAPNMITGSPMTLQHAKPLIAWNTNCPKCGASFTTMKMEQTECAHDVSFIEEIQVFDVLNAIHQLELNKKETVNLV